MNLTNEQKQRLSRMFPELLYITQDEVGGDEYRWKKDNSLLIESEHLHLISLVEAKLHSQRELADRYWRVLESIVYKTKHSGTGIEFQLLNASAPQRITALMEVMK